LAVWIREQQPQQQAIKASFVVSPEKIHELQFRVI